MPQTRPVVYQGPISGAVNLKPLGLLHDTLKQQRAMQAQREAYAQRQRDKMLEERAKQLKEINNFNPEAALPEYQEYLKDKVLGWQEGATAATKRGDQEALDQLERQKKDITLEKNRITFIKEKLNELGKRVEGDDELDTDSFYKNITKTLYDEQGNIRPPQEISMEELESAAINPVNFKWEAINERIEDHIDEEVIQKQELSGLGQLETIEQRSKYVMLDDTGEPLKDENGKIMFKMTPDVLHEYMKDGRARQVIEAQRESLQAIALMNGMKASFSNLDALKSLKFGDEYVIESKKFKNAPNPDKPNKNEVTKQDLSLRNQTIDALSAPFGMQGESNEPSEKSIRSIQSLIGNAEIAGQDILDVEIVKAGSESMFENDTKPYDRYVFKVAGGKRGGKTVEENFEVNLTKPNYWFWNGVLNTSKSEVKRIPKDKLQEFNTETTPEAGVLDDL